MVLRMMMRWAESRGFKVELLEASPGEEAGIKSATFRAAGENAYGLYSAEKGVHRLVRLSPVRLRQPPPDVVRRRRGRARWSRRRASRDRRRRPADRHLPRVRRRRPARQQDRLGGAHHAQADAASSCSARTSARSPRTARPRWRCCARSSSRPRSAGARRRSRKERGEAQDVNFGSQIRSYVLHPYTMVKDHRTDFEVGDANGVLDGDLDGFVHAYLMASRGRRWPSPTRPRTGVAHPEQPTAPYLDAVWGYAFRGSTRFHVPGHKGGAGADPGLRSALGERALMVDVPADIQGIDLGPEPTPYQRAEALAAEAHGAARSWFLTNGATPGQPRAGLALAPPGAPVVVQRNSHASVVDGLVLSGGVPTYVAPEYEPSSGWRTASRRRRSRRRSRRAGRAARGVHRLADLLRHGRRRRRARRGLPRGGVPLVVDQAWGPHFGFHPDLPASALRGRRRRAHLDAQDRRLAHAVGDAARRADRADRPGAGRAHGAADALARRPPRC